MTDTQPAEVATEATPAEATVIESDGTVVEAKASDKASRIIAIEAALAKASAEETPKDETEDGTKSATVDDDASEKEKPKEEPTKRALSDELRRKIDEANEDHRQAAKLSRAAREKLAAAEQRERQATELAAKFDAQAKAIQRLQAGDIMALADLGVPFETLQAAALANPADPKVEALQTELRKLREEMAERAQREEQARVEQANQRALAEYKSTLSKAFEGDEICAAFPDEALDLALDAQRKYVQRTGVMVDTEELVQYVSEKLTERAKRYAPIVGKLHQPSVTTSAPKPRAKPGVAPTGATTTRAPEVATKPTTRKERAEAIARALDRM